MEEFIPKESDKEWLKNLLGMIKIGGVWGTSWAIYKKVDEQTLAVVKNIEDSYVLGSIEENVNRTKIVAEAIGLKFVDQRK